MTVALQIAQRANSLRTSEFPVEALTWAKTAIIDMIGCALAGAHTDTAEKLLRVVATPGHKGRCTVIGRADTLRPIDVALVNGTIGHALDFDDTSKSLSGHPTVVIIPAVLALAEVMNSSGRDLLDAYLVGLETCTRIARGVNFYHYEKGWHPTATLGIFGAAAACGHLLRLDDSQMATALSLCVSHAAGVKSNFGTQTKPLHAGLAARNGLFSAQLAHENFTANLAAFEHPQGFFEVYNGKGNYDPAKIMPAWGAPLDILAPGISIKKYPCVYSVHGAIDAAIALHHAPDFDPTRIDKIVVVMHRRRLLPHVQRRATTALDAKFSLPYAVARALFNGQLSMTHFSESAIQEPAVRALMDRVTTKSHDDDANDYSATVEVYMADGKLFTKSVAAPLGRGPEVPLPQDMLRAKFEDCAGRTLDRDAAAALFDALSELEHRSSIRDLTAAMAPKPRNSRR
jgi:2-methylcitrate dehydratase PrpD